MQDDFRAIQQHLQTWSRQEPLDLFLKSDYTFRCDFSRMEMKLGYEKEQHLWLPEQILILGIYSCYTGVTQAWKKDLKSFNYKSLYSLQYTKR